MYTYCFASMLSAACCKQKLTASWAHDMSTILCNYKAHISPYRPCDNFAQRTYLETGYLFSLQKCHDQNVFSHQAWDALRNSHSRLHHLITTFHNVKSHEERERHTKREGERETERHTQSTWGCRNVRNTDVIVNSLTSEMPCLGTCTRHLCFRIDMFKREKEIGRERQRETANVSHPN